MNTLQSLLNQSSPLPMLERRMLMQRVTGFSRVQLLTRDDAVLNSEQFSLWQSLCARRLTGEPMAYILGEREFYGRMFAVSSAVLIPRPDTEVLVDAVLGLYADVRLSVLDLGTGSGAIALTLAAERPAWSVTALDVSQAALDVAKINATRHAPQTRLLLSDWFGALAVDERLDVLVSNPPYIAADDAHLGEGDVRYEPRGALTDEADGLRHYRVIIEQAANFLNTGGRVFFEHGFEQAGSVRGLFELAGYTQIHTLRDLAGHERVTFAQWQRG